MSFDKNKHFPPKLAFEKTLREGGDPRELEEGKNEGEWKCLGRRN